MGWRFWIDRGGTFTDIVARRPDGSLETAKLLSENPGQYEDAAIAGMRRSLGLSSGEAFPAEAVDSIKMGTTVATNALLERRGEPTVLVITRGFADALYIARQNRPKLFDLAISRPAPLYDMVVEANERIAADGAVLTPLDEDALQRALEQARARGLRAVAIALLHGYRAPAHERRAMEIARRAGFAQVSASHEVAPLMRIVPRGQTTVADAYLSPVLGRYVNRVQDAVGGAPLYFMQSSGGLTAAAMFRGRDAILSGPAGGVVGAVETTLKAGFERIIGFDMGGTSTDVSHYRGEYERSHDAEVAGARLTVPMMAIHTVAAGGGSVCGFDGLRLRVGPDSAGAHPGPLCYRNGGPLTVTDCNLLLGRLQSDFFPAVFGDSGDAPLDADAVEEAFGALVSEVSDATGRDWTAPALAEGFLTVAVEHMARAIKTITVERGHDVTRYALAAFGGAGGQLGCRVADALAMETVVIHPLAGVLSALGMGLADLRDSREESCGLPLADDSHDRIADRLEALGAAALDSLEEQGATRTACRLVRRAYLRYRGTDTPLAVEYETPEQARADFESAHRRAFGFADPERDIDVDSLAVEAIAPGDRSSLTLPGREGSGTPIARRSVWCGDGWRDAPVWRRADLPAHRPVAGPAIILEDTSTTVVDPGWQAMRQEDGVLVLTRREARPRVVADSETPDPVLLEVFNNLFMSVAEQMGAVLEQTAHSVNMKERLDFSCAVFDTAGNLVANAPHMPVHLGSMGESVKAVIAAMDGGFAPGDAAMMNDPYNGGTHLPDVTVVTPVFLDEGRDAPDFYVAARGHHADIGGIAPGSMPSNSRSIEEEGILIPPTRIMSGGRFLEDELRSLLTGSRWPARDPDRNIADLKAQLAANETGVREVRRLVGEYGRETVARYMDHVRANATESVRRVIDRLQDGETRYRMDGGLEIAVRLSVDPSARRVCVDFTGSSPQHEGNFNAPRAVARAAVLYVFRCLVGEEIPLNDGCLEPIEIVNPEGCLLNPRSPAAVVAGNVETSQAVTNALFLAAGALAAAQGTMNNLTFGNARHQYYETLCGGAGAGRGFAGEPAVHTHMTNSRLTDPEVLESRHPVRIRDFAIRRGSGGAGRWRGGDGVRREIEFLEEMDINLLSGHRDVPPPGLAGGSPGATGRNLLRRADGQEETLGGAASCRAGPGDRLVVETPGGGGYGASEDE